MKSLTGLLAALVLTLVAVVPAGAQDEVALNEPCGKDGAFTEASSFTPDTPLLPGDVTTVTYVLDLAGIPVGQTATVDVALEWGDVTDYDLDANGSASGSFNPTDGEGESVSLTKVKHCGAITVNITNFAGNPLATMDLTLTPKNIK